jgi:predicted nucleic-acid-binding protein
MQDDLKQSAKATKFIEGLTVESPGFLSIISVVELGWVLSSCYGLSREQIVQVFESLLMTKEMLIDRSDQVLKALRMFKVSRADFADCLVGISAAAAGCTSTVTFDQGAVKAAGMVLLT